MRWVEHIADELPTQRDDEPESLRDDIVDELADHLQCALTRELHFTQDELDAKRIVLARFGNVCKVARQLWFDALKEKIMSQRVSLALSLVMAVACLASVGIMWQMLGQTKEILAQTTDAYDNLLESNRDSTERLMAQSQEANDALLEKLASVAAPTESKSLEWNNVKVRLVANDRPLEGVEAHLYRRNESDPPQTVSVKKTTGDDGLVDFGLQRTGNYALYLTTPWQEVRKTRITVKPGQELFETIEAPAAAPPEHAVNLVVDWPDDLRQRKFWAIADIRHEFRDVKGWQEKPEVWSGSLWREQFGPTAQRRGAFARSRWRGGSITSRVVVNNEGEVAEYKSSYEFAPPLPVPGGFGTGPRDMTFASQTRSPDDISYQTIMLVLEADSLEFQPRVEWTGESYQLVNLAVALPRENVAGSAAGPDSQHIELSGAYFTFTPGEDENTWKLQIPDELLEIVRGNLKQAAEKANTEASGAG